MTGDAKTGDAKTGDGAGHASVLYDVGRHGPVLRLHVQPGSTHEGVVGVHGNALKLRVRAPAASGQANEAVLALLAREFGAPAASLRLTGGETSRDKRVLFTGLPVGDFDGRLARALARAVTGPAP
ncbi:MAG: DUF167 domain-containing protein [Acidimicrobiales bacterium]|jgi:uncharacterized protein